MMLNDCIVAMIMSYFEDSIYFHESWIGFTTPFTTSLLLAIITMLIKR